MVLENDLFPAIALIVGGLLSTFIAIYGKRDDSHLDELATYSGFILGVAVGVLAFFAALDGVINWFTLAVMIILALTLFLKPLKDIPFAGIAGLIVGGIAVYGASLFLPAVVFGVDRWIILVIIFFIIGTIVFLLFRFIEEILKIARMVLDWKPVMIIVGLVAIIEGGLLFLNTSLITLL